MASEAPVEGKYRRDLLVKIQTEAQARWEAAKIFESDAPADGVAPEGKFFGNFPYPYMNGLLHLGHAFSLSKLEFAAAYHRMCGKKVLFPQAFHCTGMPIKACADKLARELELYGNPPVFPEEDPNAAAEEAAVDAPADVKTDPTKFTAKKSKANAKKGTGTTQWGILKHSGIPEEILPKFADPTFWLEYFPPLAKRDIALMGCGVDWRRSFITTDVNKYYDQFIRWQFNSLKKQGKVVKDKRYTVYSPLDGQPCADHDRATGEGVGAQEYTLVKMKVAELSAPLQAAAGKDVFFLAATLRPETMYGQTNCWVLPEGEYVLVEGLGNEAYVMAERSANNLAYQDKLPTWGKPNILATVTGQELIGTKLVSPNCPHAVIYALPMLTILTTKGTGIVTSVPSDSPDDYRALLDLIEKPKLREKYGVQDEWVLPFEVIPIIDIPGLGSTAAKAVCEELKIASQNDAKKLAEAKQMTYLKGFTDGVMIVGPHSGKKVSEVKPVIKQELLDAGHALLYSEPEKTVMSRSGDECVVALTDQWYIIYGEEEWKKLTETALASLETYHDEVRNAFAATLDWLNQWACSRSFGLGTRLPWDPQFLVESLSDSTIYMAFYTIAHLLQGGDMFGREDRTGIDPSALTDAFWDYIFLDGPKPTLPGLSAELLDQMKSEFNFWYPFDLRVSGKDLIQNHLTFALYTHTAFFAKDKWPKAMRCNGHLLLNSEKMSKSTGNFKTLAQAIFEYSSDAMRMALADAGDGVDDANFEDTVANASILRLTKEMTWIEETLASQLREGEPSTFADRVFDTAIDNAIQLSRSAFERMHFRDALKHGVYDLQSARDVYRFACGPEGVNGAVIRRYIEVSCQLLAPLAPHTADHIWVNILKKSGSVLVSGWPVSKPADAALMQASRYLEDLIPSLRKSVMAAEKPGGKKGKAPVEAAAKVTGITMFVKEEYTGWHRAALELLQPEFDAATGAFKEGCDVRVVEALAAHEALAAMNEKARKGAVMPFVKFKKEQAVKVGASVLSARLPFDEKATLADNRDYLLRALGLETLTVADIAEVPEGTDAKEAAPGNPIVTFTKVPVA